MARQRDPLAARPLYSFAVFGKPVSVWTGTDRKPEKSEKYAKWRDEVIAQVTQTVAELSSERGFELILDPVCISLIWYSPSVDDEADADLDNMAKPYLDALQGQVISNDRKVQLLRTIKVDINSQLQNVPGVLEAKNSQRLETAHEFVMIVIEPLNDGHFTSFPTDLNNE